MLALHRPVESAHPSAECASPEPRPPRVSAEIPPAPLTPDPTKLAATPGILAVLSEAAQPFAPGPGSPGYRTDPSRQPPHWKPSSRWGGPRAGGREPSGRARDSRWPRICPITAGFSILAITLTLPPHAAQVSISMPNSLGYRTPKDHRQKHKTTYRLRSHQCPLYPAQASLARLVVTVRRTISGASTHQAGDGADEPDAVATGPAPTALAVSRAVP